MKLEFFDDDKIPRLYPLTLTRPAADLRCGILTIAEKWNLFLESREFGYQTRDYLVAKFPGISSCDVRINGRLLPTPNMVYQIQHMETGQRLMADGTLLAERPAQEMTEIETSVPALLIDRPYDLFLHAGAELEKDFAMIADHNHGINLHPSNQHTGAHPIYIEDGAVVSCSIINTDDGPVYIGKNAHVMEGCLIRGPFAMGEGSVLKMGAKVYGKTALGPYCVVGGEVNNIQMQGYSNKGHDGFLGNAVIGEWCNIGADTNCSNLKNNYEEVKVWNYDTGRFDKSGQQFCGLIMGDHAKSGINTMFNTGTVVGVAANVFGPGFPRQFIPDFAWGGTSGFTTYKLDAACNTASLVMPRRKRVFDETEQLILTEVFNMTAVWRNWE